MSDFIQSRQCLSGWFCKKCRDKEGGRAHRKAIQSHGLALPVAEPGEQPCDFTCPPERGGKPWGYDIIPVTVERRAINNPERKKREPRQPKPPPDPLPYLEWPMSARIFSWLKQPGEIGLGDTVANQLKVGGKDLVKRMLKAAKIKCGCSERQKWMNARFPYCESLPDGSDQLPSSFPQQAQDDASSPPPSP